MVTGICLQAIRGFEAYGTMGEVELQYRWSSMSRKGKEGVNAILSEDCCCCPGNPMPHSIIHYHPSHLHDLVFKALVAKQQTNSPKYSSKHTSHTVYSLP